MMTELEGMNTANMLKVHVAAETVVSGRSVVEGLATGPIYHVEDGDISGAPDGAILVVPEDFDGEFSGDTERISGIVDAHEGLTSYAAIVARELSIPMVADAELPDRIDDDDILTLDAERGVVYEEAGGREQLPGR
jgi:pyruvate kinase